jgi:hypothetical protein
MAVGRRIKGAGIEGFNGHWRLYGDSSSEGVGGVDRLVRLRLANPALTAVAVPKTLQQCACCTPVIEGAMPFAIVSTVMRLCALAILALAAIALVHERSLAMPILINVIAHRALSPPNARSNYLPVQVRKESDSGDSERS